MTRINLIKIVYEVVYEIKTRKVILEKEIIPKEDETVEDTFERALEEMKSNLIKATP